MGEAAEIPAAPRRVTGRRAWPDDTSVTKATTPGRRRAGEGQATCHEPQVATGSDTKARLAVFGGVAPSPKEREAGRSRRPGRDPPGRSSVSSGGGAVGSAPGWGPGGRRFETCSPDHHLQSPGRFVVARRRRPNVRCMSRGRAVRSARGPRTAETRGSSPRRATSASTRPRLSGGGQAPDPALPAGCQGHGAALPSSSSAARPARSPWTREAGGSSPPCSTNTLERCMLGG